MNKNINFTPCSAKQWGFTLIELLVTIVIGGILATTSVSTFQGHFEKARIARAQHFVTETDHQLKAEIATNEFNSEVQYASFDEVINGDLPFSSEVILKKVLGGPITLSNDTPNNSGKSLAVVNSIRSEGKININNEITISTWLKNSGGWMRFSSPNKFRIEIIVPSNNTSVHFIDDVTGYSYQFSITRNDTKWHNLIVSYDNNTKIIKIYLDGILKNINKLPNINNFPSGNDEFYFYVYKWGLSVSLLDNLKIYSQAIKGQEDVATDAVGDPGQQ